MTRVVIELDEKHERLLRERAVVEQRSPQEICRDAVEGFLRGREELGNGPVAIDCYAAFRKMIALVPAGPNDASVRHDHRSEDDAP